MNFLNIFEDHVAGIFGATRAPFSFKKLAKQAARDMEDQTLVINGVNTAPALYTILIAAAPDPLAVADPFAPSVPDPAAAPIPVPQTVSRDALAGMGGAAATGAAVGLGAAAGIASNMASTRAPQRPLAQLVDVVSGESHSITSAQVTIGRERSVSDIALRDPNVSRRHAQLTFTGSDWSIEDLNSTNGTLVNNRRITRCPLRNGDLLTFGLSTFEFRG